MREIWTLGEALCEIMREGSDRGLASPDVFRGPYPSGAPAIFIDTAARLGCGSGLIGTVGRDAFGSCILERFRRDGVNCSHMSVSDTLATAVAFVSYTGTGDRSFIFHIGNAAAGEVHYPRVMPQNVGVFHVMGCAMMPSSEMARSIVRAVRYYDSQGAVISFDPNIRLESLRDQDLHTLTAPVLERCSVLMPGKEELLAIAEESTVEGAAQKLFENPVLRVIVLKDGSRGSRVMTRSEDFSVPACRVAAVDVTGAGDSFDAGFLVGYLAGRPLAACARLASATAALNCAAFGPMEGTISPETVREMIEANYPQI